MSLVTNAHAKEILDSRGNPTIEVEVKTASGFVGCAMAPSGVSTGEREALRLRNGDPSRYGSRGVLQAVEGVNNILIDMVLGVDVANQAATDKALIDADGTKDESKYGVNAILGTSLAVAHAAADYCGLPLHYYLGGINAKTLPVPMMDILDGGGHADSSVDFQELMITPVSARGIREAVRMGAETFHALKKALESRGQVTATGGEGGFASDLEDNGIPLKCIMEVVGAASSRAGEDTCIVMDVAVNEFYNVETKMYDLKKSGQGSRTIDEMIAWYDELIEKYPTISIEDGLGEHGWGGWKRPAEHLGKKIQVVGDDLFIINPAILQEGTDEDIADSTLIKMNRIGTLTETFDAMELAKKHSYMAVISHRSGETKDVVIANIAVTFNTGQVKIGPMSRVDHIAKYNQLLHIEEELGDVALLQGKPTFYNVYEH